MKYSFHILFASLLLLPVVSCKKKGCTDPTAENYSSSAKKDDGSCYYATTYAVPTTYAFTNSTGNSTVNYDGQTDRINQLAEMIEYAESGEISVIDAQILKDMFANTGGNGNGHFTFTSTRQLKDKCFSLDQSLIESYFDSIAVASVNFASTATNGHAGTLTSGASTYLISANGFDYAEMIEKIAQKINNLSANIKFILLTEQLSFIPDNILNCCETIHLSRPSKTNYNKCLKNKIPNDINLSDISNIKDLKVGISSLMIPHKIICNKIYDEMINVEQLKFLK